MQVTSILCVKRYAVHSTGHRDTGIGQNKLLRVGMSAFGNRLHLQTMASEQYTFLKYLGRFALKVVIYLVLNPVLKTPTCTRVNEFGRSDNILGSPMIKSSNLRPVAENAWAHAPSITASLTDPFGFLPGHLSKHVFHHISLGISLI
jgi:fatty acid desaturase